MTSPNSDRLRFLGRLGIRVALIAAGLSLLLLTAESGPILLRLGVYLVPMALLVWIVWNSMPAPAQRVRQLLAQGRLGKAYRLAVKRNCRPLVRDYLGSELALPNASLREPILSTYDELNLLHDSSADRANRFVETGLKTSMWESTREGLNALWNICANLEVVARQRVDFQGDHPKIKGIGERLVELGSSTRRARVKLAELSLGSTQEEVEEARLAMEMVRRQSEFLLELESALG